MILATKAGYEKALRKATELRTAANVYDCGSDKYAVLSSNGQTTYRVDARNWACTCPAGQASHVCYHAAGVHIYRMAQSMVPAIKVPAKYLLGWEYPSEPLYCAWVTAGRPAVLKGVAA